MKSYVDSERRNWYVLYTKPKAERKVKYVLDSKDLETFLPLYQKIVQWSDRKKKIWVPLFPSYLFININLKEMHEVYGVPGILKFLTTRGVKNVIPSKEINAIKLLLQGSPEPYNLTTELGEEVKIEFGPFVGLHGKLINYKGKNKLLVLLRTIKQNVIVEVSSKHIRLLKK